MMMHVVSGFCCLCTLKNLFLTIILRVVYWGCIMQTSINRNNFDHWLHIYIVGVQVQVTINGVIVANATSLNFFLLDVYFNKFTVELDFLFIPLKFVNPRWLDITNLLVVQSCDFHTHLKCIWSSKLDLWVPSPYGSRWQLTMAMEMDATWQLIWS